MTQPASPESSLRPTPFARPIWIHSASQVPSGAVGFEPATFARPSTISPSRQARRHPEPHQLRRDPRRSMNPAVRGVDIRAASDDNGRGETDRRTRVARRCRLLRRRLRLGEQGWWGRRDTRIQRIGAPDDQGYRIDGADPECEGRHADRLQGHGGNGHRSDDWRGRHRTPPGDEASDQTSPARVDSRLLHINPLDADRLFALSRQAPRDATSRHSAQLSRIDGQKNVTSRQQTTPKPA